MGFVDGAGRAGSRGSGARAQQAPAQRVTQARPVAAGTLLFRRGEVLRQVYAIDSGVVQVSRSVEQDRCRIIGLALAGDVVGCEALSGGVYGGDALVVRDASIRAIDPWRWSRAARGSALTQLLGLADLQMARMVRQAVRLRLAGRARVADFLLQLAERAGGAIVEFPLEGKAVADYLGLRPESLSRILRRLAEARCLRRAGGTRFELDLERLRRLSA